MPKTCGLTCPWPLACWRSHTSLVMITVTPCYLSRDSENEWECERSKWITCLLSPRETIKFLSQVKMVPSVGSPRLWCEEEWLAEHNFYFWEIRLQHTPSSWLHLRGLIDGQQCCQRKKEQETWQKKDKRIIQDFEVRVRNEQVSKQGKKNKKKTKNEK